MKKLSIMLFFMFSALIMKAENFNSRNPTPELLKVEFKEIYLNSFNYPVYYWFNFGGCWHLYSVEDGHATPMNSTNYFGTTTICNEASQNVC